MSSEMRTKGETMRNFAFSKQQKKNACTILFVRYNSFTTCEETDKLDKKFQNVCLFSFLKKKKEKKLHHSVHKKKDNKRLAKFC